jgi:FeS assembly SUF system protein
MAPAPDADPFSFLQNARKPDPEMDAVERPAPDEGDENLKEQVMAALKTVRDPEIPVNLVDLGLIYELIVRKDGLVYVEMTLTTPACPVAGALPGQVRDAITAVPGVQEARVKLVWEPSWTKDRMSEEARLELGLMD